MWSWIEPEVVFLNVFMISVIVTLRFAVKTSLRQKRILRVILLQPITSLSCEITLQDLIYPVTNQRNVSARPVTAAADQFIYSKSQWCGHVNVRSPLVLAGFAPEELGQCGNGAEVTGVTRGRSRQRGEGFCKDSRLQETHGDRIKTWNDSIQLIRHHPSLRKAWHPKCSPITLHRARSPSSDEGRLSV